MIGRTTSFSGTETNGGRKGLERGGEGLEYRSLGSTGLRVSEIGFGCGSTAGLLCIGTPDEQRAAVQHALETGINYFDTAPNYAQGGEWGQSEMNLGRVLKELDAHPIVGTKVEFHAHELDDIPGTIARSIDASLERLDRESVDILYLHNRIGKERFLSESAMGSRLSMDDVLGLDGVLECLQRIRQEGRARLLAFCSSGGDPEVNRQIVNTGGFDVVQLTYNLLNPTEGRPPPAGFKGDDQGQIIDHAAARGMGVVVIRVLGGGGLSGSPEPHRLSKGTQGARLHADAMTRARAMSFLQNDDQTLAQGAIRFAIGKKEVSTVLVGFSEASQIDAAAQAAGRGGLGAAELARIEELYASDFGAATPAAS